jgi:hypothetical protein
VNPVLALYNHVKEQLRCKAVRAFNRIMDIIDEDQDGALNDLELNRFHEFAFGRPPREEELKNLKQVPQPSTDGGNLCPFSHCELLMADVPCRY